MANLIFVIFGHISMAHRSSLELMLEKIQQLEDQPEDIPPALPVRPVSRARGRRPPRLNFHCQDFEKENGDFICEIKGTKKEELYQFQKRVQTMDICKGIDVIQKWYRGHKVRRSYEELRTGALALQSLVRGKNVRRNYEYGRRKRLEAIVVIQKHVRKYFKPKRGIGGYRDQWHCNETEHEPKAKGNEDSVLNVPYDVVVDLWRRVLVTEARAREKKEESAVLRVKIREIEEKWKQHEKRMAAMEKAWQDELMHIQVSFSVLHLSTFSSIEQILTTRKSKCLAGAKSHQANPGYIRIKKKVHHWRHYRQNGERNGFGDDEHPAEQGSGGLRPEEELCKLKKRFKAWKREYMDKLREVQWTLKKLGNSEALKSHKKWWGRFS